MQLFARLGAFAYRRRYWVLAAWLGVVVAAVVAGGPLFDRLATVSSLSADAESARAEARIEELIADGPMLFAVVEGMEVYSPELGDSVHNVVAQLQTIPGVAEVNSNFTPSFGEGADQRSILITVELAEELEGDPLEQVEDAVVARLHQIDAPSVRVGGDHLAERAFGTQAARDLAIGESVAFALLIVALIVILGGVLAALLPLTVAVIGVGTTLLVLYGVSLFTTVGEYSLNIVTLLGIGLAVDYSLLIVARFREQRAAGEDVPSRHRDGDGARRPGCRGVRPRGRRRHGRAGRLRRAVPRLDGARRHRVGPGHDCAGADRRCQPCWPSSVIGSRRPGRPARGGVHRCSYG